MSTRIVAATELLPEPTVGRTFSVRRPVRLGDISPRGRLRLDAAARWLQDVATDDADDAELSGTWVVRRTLMSVTEPVRYRESVAVTTWCSGRGGRWAERRTALVGDDGGRLDAVSCWVAVDTATGAPARLGDEFDDVYGEACAGRTVRASLLHGEPSSDAAAVPWTWRFADVDVMGHVNNAVYWAAVEEVAGPRRLGGRVTAEVEFRAGVDIGDPAAVVRAETDGGFDLWFVVDDEVRASARLRAV